MRVWVLWHIPPEADARGDYMLIGLYSTREASLAAVQRLAGRPGFADHPEVVENTDRPGFFTEAYELDQDHWTEGYVSSE